MHFQAVIFDWRGTLVTTLTEDAWAEAALALLGHDAAPGRVEAVTAAVRAAGGADDHPGIDADAAFHRATYLRAFADAGIDADLAEALYSVESDFRCDPFAIDVAATLRELKERGYRIAILSDIHFDLRPAFDAAGMDGLVDVFTLSFEQGMQKPDPRMFHRTLTNGPGRGAAAEMSVPSGSNAGAGTPQPSEVTSMRYGVALPNGGSGADPRMLAELAALAERSGWDGVFVEDHLVHHSGPDAPTCDPWVALAAIAVATETVVIGPQVTPLPRRKVWKVAREAVTLDHLSGGRLVLGVGLGGDVYETGFAMTGEEVDKRRRARMLDESLDVLTGLWTGEPFTYEGGTVAVHDAVFRPTPVQTPRIPIWVGGTWPYRGPSERAARWDGFLPLAADESQGLHGPDAVRAIREFVAARRGDTGNYDIVMGGADRGDDWESGRAFIGELADAGATWWVEYVSDRPAEGMREAVGRGPLRVP